MAKSFILDVSKVKTTDDFFDEVHRVLCPDFKSFGRNWNAFIDILRGGFGPFEENESVEIILQGIKKMKKHLPESQFGKIVKLLENADNVTLSQMGLPRN